MGVLSIVKSLPERITGGQGLTKGKRTIQVAALEGGEDSGSLKQTTDI